MGLNLTIFANYYPFLNFHKGADKCVITYLTFIVFPAGEYVINIHYYNSKTLQPVAVTVYLAEVIRSTLDLEVGGPRTG